MAGFDLPTVLHSWKSFTAKKANQLLRRTGAFWQKEYYDHLVRDGEDLLHQVRYVLQNPTTTAGRAWSCWGDRWDHSVAQELRRDAAATDCGGTPQPLLNAPDSRFTSLPPSFDPFHYERRRSSVREVMGHELGGDRTVRVVVTQETWNAVAPRYAALGDTKPEIICEKSGVVAFDPRDDASIAALNARPEPVLVTVCDGIPLDPVHAFRLLAFRADPRHPVLLKDTLVPPTGEVDSRAALLEAARVVGSLLCDGIGDAVLVRGETAAGASLRLAFNILQATGARIFKTDYVACPSCGRTLFNLQSTTRRIREATGHLKGVRIAVMGCIVNGPGEMADADFGYVGGAPGKINLYVGREAVKFNIPAEEAVERLIDLIREHGKWSEPPATVSARP
jgi:(E)-4-hydroxy-3-methylbut-2-enyl-diphosphate synthase